MSNLYGGLPFQNLGTTQIPNYLPFLPLNSFGRVQSSQTNFQQVVTPRCQQHSPPRTATAWENLETLANAAFSNTDEH